MNDLGHMLSIQYCILPYTMNCIVTFTEGRTK